MALDNAGSKSFYSYSRIGARLVDEITIGQIVPTKRSTLYRMSGGCTIETAFLESRRETDSQFVVEEIEVGGRPARLVHGSISSRAKWASDVLALTGRPVESQNSSPGAALALQDHHGTVWAITWGTGFHLLDSEQIDFGFGASVVARSALPTEVKSLTKTVLDHRARVDRSSLPRGSTVRDLGVDGYGEVVSRVEAKARIVGMSAGDGVLQLRAAESLNLPLAKRPEPLLADLQVLHDLAAKKVLPGLESLEQLVALKPRDARVEALDEQLRNELLSGAPTRLGLSWPHERLDAYGPVASVRVSGFGDRKPRVYNDVPEIADVLEWMRQVPRDEVLERLKSIRLELHSSAEPERATLVSTPVPLRRWLAFEVKQAGERFCLHDGGWYRMDDRYLARIDARIVEILGEQPSVALPAWPASEGESDYNIRAAAALGGLSLDRKLIATPLHSRGGIEPCDIFVSPGVLIHVKRGRSSADLSHLLAQGLVSTDALARDENARRAWTERIRSESGGRVDEAELQEVVLAIGSRRPVDADSLFTFTKVNLVKQTDALRYLGVAVRVLGVPE